MKAIIAKSKLHGQGLFAKNQIRKGEIVFIAKGEEIKFLISDKEKAKIAGMNWLGVGKNKWLDSQNHLFAFINHSCSPNCGIRGKVTFVALKDIMKGDELTFDYSLNEADIFYDFKCKCKSESCRKIIKSIQFLPQETFDINMQYIPKYFQSVYRRYKVDNFKNQKELRFAWVDFIKRDFEK